MNGTIYRITLDVYISPGELLRSDAEIKQRLRAQVDRMDLERVQVEIEKLKDVPIKGDLRR